jgi:2-polyprenyl-3-methyl-5-hydroxy-6-metoxy-1,4-benzoquinol methylase
MTMFDRSFWEGRWSQVLREHADRVAHRPPNAHLTAEVMNLRPGLALDAGCGQGSDTLWLAAADQVQVSVDAPAAALDPDRWALIVAEDRPRAIAGTGVDAVICARRLS